MSYVFDDAISGLARQALAEARVRKLKLATAESCTGGLVAGALTDIPGSSDVFDRGYSTYSNEAKVDMLGVDPGLLRQFGAVSAETAQAMAEGVLSRSPAGAAVAITGIAGPGGGTLEKPAGLVHFAAARRGQPSLTLEKRFGDIGRAQVRLASVATALELLIAALRKA